MPKVPVRRRPFPPPSGAVSIPAAGRQHRPSFAPRKSAALRRWMLCAALAASPLAAADPLIHLDQPPVSDGDLASQRGGLIHRNGLEIALGLEQITLVNGEEVARTVLRNSSSSLLESKEWGGVLIQTGLDGATVDSFTGGGWATVIQNRLDGQKILHKTLMNIDISGVDVSRVAARRQLDAHIVEHLTVR